MFNLSPEVTGLIDELRRLPGIGRKSAQRIAFFLLKNPAEKAYALAEAIAETRKKIVECSICHTITTSDPCEICSNRERDRKMICVVEEPFNIYSIEKTGMFNGLYHVLQGNLSPIRGIGPDELKINSLLHRVGAGGVSEVVLATSPTTEGNATAHYIGERLREFSVRTTRIALGLPVGADIDYADSITIARSFEGRREV